MNQGLLVRASALIIPLAFVIVGAASIWDAQRIGRSFRRSAGYDMLGAGGYLYFVGGLLMVCGVLLAGHYLRQALAARRRAAAGGPGEGVTGAALALMAGLPVYALLMPIFGYALSTAAFLCFAFAVSGMRSRAELAVATIGCTGAVYCIFVLLGDMPLPRGTLFPN